jgi:predicted metalloprotease
MDWQDSGPSQDIEDRRGDSGGGGGFNLGGGPIGIGIFIIVAIVSLVSGHNYLPLLLRGSGPAATTQSARPATSSPAEKRDVDLISYTLDDAQRSWAQTFAAAGHPYRHARLVLFRDRTYSGCGNAQAATGPFYCPQDEKIYIDLGFWDELTRLGGSTSDFAKSYVITHELGHHIQNLLGIERREQQLVDQDPSEESPASVALELQADCFAGVWGHATQQRSKISQEDINQALKSAAAVGDDHIQKTMGRAVSPESWTHGSSAQREHWFMTGMQTGKASACTTFNGKMAP